MYQRGYALGIPHSSLALIVCLMEVGQESKALGIHVQLGPVAGPLGKIPVAGRNWEGFSNDPYLAGVGMAEVSSPRFQSSGVSI
jgi:hypothetical protein